MLKKQLLIVGFSCCLVACASVDEQGETAADEGSSRMNNCIHKPSVRGYSVLDEQNLIIDAAARRKYHVVLQRRAYGIRSSHQIAFDSATSRICSGFDAIRYSEGMGSGRDERVRIASIRELSKEDEEHLLIQFGKKEPEIKHTPAPQEVEGAEVEELDESASE